MNGCVARSNWLMNSCVPRSVQAGWAGLSYLEVSCQPCSENGRHMRRKLLAFWRPPRLWRRAKRCFSLTSAFYVWTLWTFCRVKEEKKHFRNSSCVCRDVWSYWKIPSACVTHCVVCVNNLRKSVAPLSRTIPTLLLAVHLILLNSGAWVALSSAH